MAAGGTVEGALVYASTSSPLATPGTKSQAAGPRVDFDGAIPDAIQTITFDVKALPAHWCETRDESLQSIRGRADSGWTERLFACSIRGDPWGTECAAAHAAFFQERLLEAELRTLLSFAVQITRLTNCSSSD
jgi:hypothetical protein